MASKLSNEDEPIADINITPFVDIILVVLIIFMLATPVLMNPGINVNLPEAASGESTNPTQFNVTMTSDGKIFLNGEVADQAKISSEAAKSVRQDPNLQAIISADKDVPHGQVIGIIDKVKSAGIKKFAISTQGSK